MAIALEEEVRMALTRKLSDDDDPDSEEAVEIGGGIGDEPADGTSTPKKGSGLDDFADPDVEEEAKPLHEIAEEEDEDEADEPEEM